MSVNQSNLSGTKYGYDMVVSVTQQALNSHLKAWVEGNSTTSFTQVWMMDSSSLNPVQKDYEEVKQLLGGLDPFCVGENDTADIKTMFDKYFWFGFQAELGTPTGAHISSADIPPIVQFNEQGVGSHVTYNMLFKSFKIVNLKMGRSAAQSKWAVFDQSTESMPWVFKFDVDLDLRDATLDVNKLPPSTQKEIKNLGPDMFSLKQLFLDLNNAYLSSLPKSPTIKNLNNYMCGGHLMPYIESLRASIEKSGGGTLGSSAVAQSSIKLPTATFIPTDLNFEISSYKDANGQTDTNEQAAYTLNYLVMGYKHQMPPAVPFTWNWVDSDQLNQYSGTVAIRKEVFVDFLYNIFSKALSNLYAVPQAQTACTCSEGATYEFNLKVPSNPSPQEFQKINQGDHLLTYSFNPPGCNDSAQATCSDGTQLKSKISVAYSVQSDVYLKGNQITVKTTSKIYGDMKSSDTKGSHYWGVEVSGDFANFTDTRTFTLSTDSQGKLSVTHGGVGLVDDSSKPDHEQFEHICSNMNESVRTRLADMVKGYEGEIFDGLNSAYGWVFPGGQTFAFKDVAFSDSQDLVSNVNYKDIE
ncbi:MAG: hypothetical protein ACPGJS_06955 [Flammeovirgaceae bacterium]